MRISIGIIVVACTLVGPAPAVWSQTIGFGEAIRISLPGQRALPPHMDLGPEGSLHVLWVAKLPIDAPKSSGGHMNHDAADALFYRRSAGDGAALGQPVQVNLEPGEVWGFAVSKPVLAVAADGIVHVMFPANGIQPRTGKAILVARYTRSTDGGRSFEPSRTVNSTADNDMSAIMHGGFAAAHAFGTLTTDTDGGVHAYWIDSRFMTLEKTDGAIFSATSRDRGETFAADRVVNSENVCPCCQLAAAAAGNGVYLSSRQISAEGFRDSSVARSVDLGTRYAAPVRIGEGRWKIDGCPLKRTAVAVAGDNVYSAWFTAGQQPAGVFFARSSDSGETFEPSVAIHGDALVSDAPSVAARDDGTVMIAWHAKTGGPRRIFLSVSTDFGSTFSAPIEAPTPAGTASYPEVVMDADTSFLSFQQNDAAWLMPLTLAPATRQARR